MFPCTYDKVRGRRRDSVFNEINVLKEYRAYAYSVRPVRNAKHRSGCQRMVPLDSQDESLSDLIFSPLRRGRRG